jgi:thiol-disulfide isomerase/thioredoxin
MNIRLARALPAAAIAVWGIATACTSSDQESRRSQGSQLAVSGVQIGGAPSVVNFNGRLYAAFQANDPSNQLFITSTSDGNSWQSPAAGYPIALGSTPSLAVFNGRLYAGFKANDASDMLYVTSTSDGANWNVPAVGYGGLTMGSAPSLAAFNGLLYAAFRSDDPRNILYVTESADGSNWTIPATDYGGIQLAGTPSLAAFNNRLYVAFRANDASNMLYVTSTADGVNWATPATGYPGIQMGSDPSLAVVGNQLMCAFRANDPSNTLYVASSADGVHWSSSAQEYPSIQMGSAPSLVAFNGAPSVAFQANDPSHELSFEALPSSNLPSGPGPVQPVVNRAPLQPTPFLALPIGSVRGAGWLLEQMQLQAAGLSGHAEDIYSENGPTNQWLGGNGDFWERGPYYVRAVTALAYVLGDTTLQGNVQKWIDWAVASQTADGNFGPAALSPGDWWPRILLLRAVEDVYEATGDPTLLNFLGNYFAYQAANPIANADSSGTSMPDDQDPQWATERMEDDAMVALYTYNHRPAFSTDAFVSLFSALRADNTNWIGDFNAQSLPATPASPLPSHNVNVAMAWKAPAVYWQQSGVASDEAAYQSGLNFILTANNQPQGMSSGTESLAGPGSNQGVETCAVVDSIASHSYSLLAFGQAGTGDLIEKIAFNALTAATNKTMTGIDYYSIPNEPQAIHGPSGYPQNYANGITMSWQSGYPCCRFNWHMGWPRFTQSTWAATPDGGLAALVYAPTVVIAPVAGGQTVTFTEDTNYPFEEEVRLTFQASRAATFPLTVRIPEWATNASVTLNGAALPGPFTPASLYTIAARTWNSGDVVTLEFPMPITTTSQMNGSVSIHRGPIVYSLKIGENWVETTPNVVDGIDFGEYEVQPTTPWNYALYLNQADLSSSFQVVTRPMPANPFIQATTPVTLQATGRAVPGWGLKPGVVLAQEVPPSPVQAPGPDVSLTLVPFGAETLRITEFPVLAGGQQQLVRKERAAAGARTTLMEFYAPWCTACSAVRPSVEAAKVRLGSEAQVVRVNVDQAPGMALRWSVDTLPAFLIFRGEEAIGRHVGTASADELVDLVRKAGVARASSTEEH